MKLKGGGCEANLGGGLYKKRIALPGRGKRNSYRTLIAFKSEEKAFFIYGFAKNMRTNIQANEKVVYKRLAKDLLEMDQKGLQTMIENGKLFEVF